MTTSKIRINRLIDHTMLKPNAKFEDIRRYCLEVEKYDFHSVCIAPFWVNEVKALLTKGGICSVAGFPLGSETTRIKVLEIIELMRLGVDEIDVVANIGLVVSKEYRKISNEIREMVEASEDKILKVIIETPLLKKDLIEDMTKLLIDAGCDFVKTGTGYHGPVKMKDVKIIARVAKGKIGIKAAGGIRTYQKAISLIRAGATRIGTSTGVNIINAS